MLKKIFAAFVICLLFIARPAHAQDNMQQIKAMEDSLVIVADSMYNAFIPDDREAYTEKFVRMLVRTLKTPGSYSYAFDKLNTKINLLYPHDKSFRIFNWAVANTEITRRYYGAIQMPGDQLKLYPLIDHTTELGKYAEDSILTGGKWFGALYYKIITEEADGVTYYNLLGKNASGLVSDKKVIDPLTFNANGAVFGAPVFNVRSQNRPNERVNRFIIEYKKNVSASMNWDNEIKALYFDKLESDVNDPNRKYTYVPSGQYDGFRWNEGHWNYITNLIPVDALKDGQAPAPVPVKGKE